MNVLSVITTTSLLVSLCLAGCEAAPTGEESPDGKFAVAINPLTESPWSDCELESVLQIVNGSELSEEALIAAGLHTRAAQNIVAYRAGADEVIGTEDDEHIDSLEELDGIYFVGPVAIEQLVAIGASACLEQQASNEAIEVVFSPSPYHESHIARVGVLFDAAERSIDIAMYSFWDNGLIGPIEDAVDRGVTVRMIFNGARDDKKAPQGTRSALLESLGVDVRYVNKIMHHKFVLIDGPQDSVAQADDAILVTGSANWSWSAATRYDEHTLFAYGNDKLNLLFQSEFNLLWGHSRDLVWNEDLERVDTVFISPVSIPDDMGVGAVFTSANFEPYIHSTYGPTFKVVSGENTVSDYLVSLIYSAKTSIDIASGHLRSRPIAQALLEVHALKPQIAIRVLLDGQEYTSESRQESQEAALEECVEEAGESVSKAQKCMDVGYYFARELHDAGIPLRFKWYAYKWHYKYAEQMHHKHFIVDGALVVAGSYNLSDNAEHNTFENMVRLHGALYPDLVSAFETNFETLWVQGESEDRYEAYLDEVVHGQEDFPIVVSPMAIDTEQVQALKAAIYQECPMVSKEVFHKEPWEYTVCER
jgi:phosphatidylserine/phosphatidylglycerophosphate/cardiolipin synthase-like enzyme